MTTTRELRCPNCGADVAFESPGTIIVVCPHCNWLSYRTDVDLDSIGQVAQPAPLASHFQIGTTGRHLGVSFTVRGQLQLDHGAGLWNEWAAEDENGEWLWIAEAQGEILTFREVDPPEGKAAQRSELHRGRRYNVFGGSWVVNEVGQGSVITVAGELPIQIQIGETTAYADLQSGSNGVATLDFTRDDQPEALVGQRVRVKELELDPLTQPEHRPERIKSKRIDCKKCGGGIELVDPEHALRVGCPYCGALLEQDSDGVRAIGEEQKSRKKPAIPLASKGRLFGEELTVLGCMEKRVRAEGRWWPWREYLLRTPEGAYRWLVESDGHWSLARPIPYSMVTDKFSKASVRGVQHKHFTTGTAEVHWVIGEFYWQVRAGMRTEARDYVAPGRMLSIESDALEISASEGRHLEPSEVAAAFGKVKLPRRVGVGAIQPNPTSPGTDWKLLGAFVALLIVARIFFGMSHANAKVLEGSFGPTPTSPSQETVQFTEPFEVKADRANMRIQLRAPGLDNGWIGLNGALVNMDTGKVTTFSTSAQYYSGVDGGERWSEGSRRGSAWLGSVPSGQYRMRLSGVGYDRGLGHSYQVTARSQVPRNLYFLLALAALFVLPIFASIRWWSFEYQRWKNSDHPWGESE